MMGKDSDMKVPSPFAFGTENMVASTGPGLLLACPFFGISDADQCSC